VTLYVVATPIGNLEDLGLRAIAALKECDAIAAEDTRRTRGLLSHLGISGKDLVSLHAHSTDKDVEKLLVMLKSGTIALVTDAGTPSVSDPGEALVRAAIENGIRVIPIPGPSAVLAALSASGLATEAGFRFFGFLPRSNIARAEAIATISATPEPVVLFESPERVKETLADLARATPDRSACVAREMTKVHEEMVRGKLSELPSGREWIGEITIVLGSFRRGDVRVTDEEIDARIDEELGRGASSKQIAHRVAAWSGQPQRDVYARVVTRKQKR